MENFSEIQNYVERPTLVVNTRSTDRSALPGAQEFKIGKVYPLKILAKPTNFSEKDVTFEVMEIQNTRHVTDKPNKQFITTDGVYLKRKLT